MPSFIEAEAKAQSWSGTHPGSHSNSLVSAPALHYPWDHRGVGEDEGAGTLEHPSIPGHGPAPTPRHQWAKLTPTLPSG